MKITFFKKKKILIVGAFGERNFGDDLLLVATHTLIARHIPDGKIFVTASDPLLASYIHRLLPGSQLIKRFFALPRLWTVVIYAGGTQFYSFPKNTIDYSDNKTNLEKIIFRIKAEGLLHFCFRHILNRVLIKPKSIAIGIGIGPFKSGNELSSKRVISKIDFTWTRDEISNGYLNQWGFPNHKLSADICYATKAFESVSPRISDQTPISKNIGVVIHGWPFGTNDTSYESALIQSIKKLKNDGFVITFFSFCEPVDQALVSMLKECKYEVHVWNPEAMATQDYLNLLKNQDIIITARLHGIIFSAILGVLPIGIVLDPKIDLAMSKLDLTDLLWKSPYKEYELNNTLIKAHNNIEYYRNKLKLGLDNERLLADQMIVDAVNLLNEWDLNVQL